MLIMNRYILENINSGTCGVLESLHYNGSFSNFEFQFPSITRFWAYLLMNVSL